MRASGAAGRLTAASRAGIVGRRPLRAIRQEDDAVTLRIQSVLAAAVGLWMAHPLPGRAADPVVVEPGRLGVADGQPLNPPAEGASNQHTADRIAASLRQSGRLCRYDVHITFQNGTAGLSGQVASQAQRDEVLGIVRGVPGVERIRDALTFAAAPAVAQAQAVVPVPPTDPRPLPPTGPALAGPPGMPTDPLPVFQAPPGPPAGYNQPPLPPYAWPTYAPYNNYSRVAYPLLYPYQSWPFIGPIYPFPKVPLGWRSIKLEWYDGYWWYGKVPNGHDWWRIRYW
jgi:hypothetical protein